MFGMMLLEGYRAERKVVMLGKRARRMLNIVHDTR